MATATQIKALLQSYGVRDDERFFTVALQVAASEARQGHEQLAREIRELVERSKTRISERQLKNAIVHVAQPHGEAAERPLRVGRRITGRFGTADGRRRLNVTRVSVTRDSPQHKGIPLTKAVTPIKPRLMPVWHPAEPCSLPSNAMSARSRS